MSIVRNLADVGYKNIREVGGKAASLGELINLGVAVPPGFVVTTRAHQAGSTAAFYAAINQACAELSAVRVAVRSSAIAEDSSAASWAGQLETYLNVGQAGIAGAIIRCWESMQTERASAYAAKNGVSADDRAVAVVVQAMVDSTVAGVLFTANPVTGSPHEFVIEAAYGLGEMVVQGAVTPDTFVVSAAGQPISHQPHAQRQMLVYVNGKNEVIQLPAGLSARPTLSHPQLKQLAAMGQRIADFYGTPQDIEWAFQDETLYILQSRPITTL